MRDQKNYNIMSEKAATGVGNYIDVRNFRHVNIVISTSDSADCTIKCVAALGETAPNFASAQAVGNEYDFIEMAQLSDSSSPVRGNTGVVLTGTDICKIYAVNTDNIDWVTLNITAYAAGEITASLVAVDNN
jgi:hypothetical protein